MACREHDRRMKIWNTKNADETKGLAEALGMELDLPITIALIGELGAGKTCFVQGLARSLELDEEPVSPTFILISEHEGRIPLLHSDLYRVEPNELNGIGIEELLEEWPGVSVVEWANRYPDIFPERTIWISLHHCGESRDIKAWCTNPKVGYIIDNWEKRWRI